LVVWRRTIAGFSNPLSRIPEEYRV